MLIGGVVDDKFGDHLQAEPVRLLQHGAEIIQGAELRMHILVVGDVVAVVLERRRIERHQPDRVDAQVPDVFELGGEALEIADAVVVRIEERFDVDLIDDRVLVPKRVSGLEAGGFGGLESGRFCVVHLANFTGLAAFHR